MHSPTESLEGVLKLLKFRNRHHLVQLLRRARLELDVSDTYGSLLFSLLTTARIYAPIEDYERLHSLPDHERDEILRTLREIYPPRERDIEITSVEFLVDALAPMANETAEDLAKEIEA